MADDKPTGSLPTELISEKTFYTLGGASAAVLLTCWAINYVAVDVSWLNYKAYRLLGIILSEVFAIVIMYKTRKKSSMKWLFAFLNGLLIFVNASGLNIMTSSYIFNPKDTTANRSVLYRQQHPDAASHQLAGIFPLPRMINWWPDEKLIKQNEELIKKNNILDSVNYELKSLVRSSGDEKTAMFIRQGDSLQSIINSLTQQSNDKQKQIDQLVSSSQGSSNELQKQLADCIKTGDEKNRDLASCQASNAKLISDNRQLQAKLNSCTSELAKCNNEKGSLSNEIKELNQRLANAGNKQTTLTELLRQVCEKNKQSINSRLSRIRNTTTKDDSLRQQPFYKNVNWNAFCQSFTAWYNPVIIK
jgi:hypothetical protein